MQRFREGRVYSFFLILLMVGMPLNAAVSFGLVIGTVDVSPTYPTSEDALDVRFPVEETAERPLVEVVHSGGISQSSNPQTAICTPTGATTWNCHLEIEQLADEHTEGSLSITAESEGQSVSEQVDVTVYDLLEGTGIQYYYPGDLQRVPTKIDRRIVSRVPLVLMVTVPLTPFESSSVSIVDQALDCSAIDPYLSQEAYLLNPGTDNPTIVLHTNPNIIAQGLTPEQIATGSPSQVRSFRITCELVLTIKYGERIVKEPQTVVVNTHIPFFENTLGEVGQQYQSKIEDLDRDIVRLGNKIEKKEKIIENAELVCGIAEATGGLNSILQFVKSVVTTVLCASATSSDICCASCTVGAPPACAASVALHVNEYVVCSSLSTVQSLFDHLLWAPGVFPTSAAAIPGWMIKWSCMIFECRIYDLGISIVQNVVVNAAVDFAAEDTEAAMEGDLEDGVDEELEVDAEDLSDAEVPDADAPDTPDVEVPDAEAPDVPDAEVPDVPDAEAPSVPDTPDAEVPDVPDAEVPDVETPNVETPPVEPGEVEVPAEFGSEAPSVPDTPDVEVPDVPDAEAPEVETSEVDIGEAPPEGDGPLPITERTAEDEDIELGGEPGDKSDEPTEEKIEFENGFEALQWSLGTGGEYEGTEGFGEDGVGYGITERGTEEAIEEMKEQGISITRFDPYKSKHYAKAAVCYPGIVYNMKKERQIKCLYRGCLRNVAASGISTSNCAKQFAENMCLYVESATYKAHGMEPFATFLEEKLLKSIPPLVVSMAYSVGCYEYIEASQALCSETLTPFEACGSGWGTTVTCGIIGSLFSLAEIITVINDGFDFDTLNRDVNNPDFCAQEGFS